MAKSTQKTAPLPAITEVLQTLRSESSQTIQELSLKAGVKAPRIERALRLLQESGDVATKIVRRDKKRRTGYHLTTQGLASQAAARADIAPPTPAQLRPVASQLPDATPQILLTLNSSWHSFDELRDATGLHGNEIAPALRFLVKSGAAATERVPDPDTPSRKYSLFRLTDEGLAAAETFRRSLAKEGS